MKKAQKYNHKKIAQEIRNKIKDKRVKYICTDDIHKHTKFQFHPFSYNDFLVKMYFAKISGITKNDWLKGYNYWGDDKKEVKAFCVAYNAKI